jgi:hypothetical protein
MKRELPSPKQRSIRPPSPEESPTPAPPVPFEKHFEVFKEVEAKLKEHLDSPDSENLLIGLRVAYDEKHSSSEPGVFPFSIESGYLELIDIALKYNLGKEIPERELIEKTKLFPIQMPVLDTVYAFAKKYLQAAAGVELNVGIFTQTKSNPISYAGLACGCGGSTTKKTRVAGTSTTNSPLRSCKKGCSA